MKGLESLNAICRITLGEHRALREKRAPHAIPPICVLTIKKDENLIPLWAKSRIVALGNHKNCVWLKSDKFAPVLHGDSLQFLVNLAVQHCRPLRQGDCKNAFCQEILPPDKVTIVRPPLGNPDADPKEYWLLLHTLYGLRQSLHHWYDKINSILLSIGLHPSRKVACLYFGFIQDPSNPSSLPSQHPLCLGIYVDDFVYFSMNPEVESLLCPLLAEWCKVDFIGIVNCFLASTSCSVLCLLMSPSILANPDLLHTWLRPFPCKTGIKCLLQLLVGQALLLMRSHLCSKTRILLLSNNARMPIRFSLKKIGWLTHSTRPDLSTIHSFLSAYSNKPLTSHMKAALLALHFIYSTHDYGISFTSDNIDEMHSFIHLPLFSDVEAYRDALPPKQADLSTFPSYSNACWDSQIGNAVTDATLLPLFKFRSMSGEIVFKNGGPLGWLADCQESTSLSSCEVEIWARNSTSKKDVDFLNLCLKVLESGGPISDVNKSTPIYNDKDACI